MDHKAEAERLKSDRDDSGKPTSYQMEGLIDATLYAAEQQRIANLIAIASLNEARADFTEPWDGPQDTDAWREIRAQVVEGLGL